MTEKAIVHEVGHATKQAPPNGFYRKFFGASLLDHSDAAGLMDENATQPKFTPNEKKILQGIIP